MPERRLPPALAVLDLAVAVCLGINGEAQAARRRAQAVAEDWFRAAVPRLLDLVLDQIDLTELVLRRVDLDRIAATLDVDAVAARLDVDAVAARLDLDAVADRLDVARVLDRMDLTELVLLRVDLDRIAATLDVDAVAARLDLDRVAAELDVDRVAARIDLDAIIGRLDVIALAEYVVNGIDLPRIIRESTGSVASESLRGVRSRSIEADQAVAQFMDRVLLRRRSSRSGQNGAGAPTTGGTGAD